MLDLEEKEKVGGRAKAVTVAGTIFCPTLRRQRFGISISASRKRLECGWTLEQEAGLEQPPEEDAEE